MNKINKVAASFKVKLAEVYNKTYKDLIQLNNLAQVIPIDPYSTLEPNFVEKAKDLAKSVAILVDKAYRVGLSAEDLAFSLKQISNKLTSVMLLVTNDSDSDTINELNSFKSLLDKIVPATIPAFKKAPNIETSEDEQIGKVYQFEGPDDVLTGKTQQLEDPAKLEEVVNQFVNQTNDPSFVHEWK